MSLKIWDGLREICTKTEADLISDLIDDNFDVTVVNKTRYYAFQDNGSDVLAVAHLDTIRPEWRKFRFNRKERKVYSPALDDRLGVFILTKILPSYGIMPDILLTTDEEIGASTALYFNPDKNYNWMFSFDRRGDDVVMYDYHTEDLEDLLEENGFNVAMGSYSDICYLDHLGIAGFNFGTGYFDEHTKRCHAILDITINMVAKFIGFFENFMNTKFEYIPSDFWGWPLTKNDDSWGDDYLEVKKLGLEDDYGDDYYLYDDRGDEDIKISPVTEAILFEEYHLAKNHMVEYYLIDDVSACMVCHDCNKRIFFNG